MVSHRNKYKKNTKNCGIYWVGTPQGSLSPLCASARPAKMQELPCIGSNPKCKVVCMVYVSPATGCWLRLMSSFLTDWAVSPAVQEQSPLELVEAWLRLNQKVLWNDNSWLILMAKFCFCNSLTNSQRSSVLDWQVTAPRDQVLGCPWSCHLVCTCERGIALVPVQARQLLLGASSPLIHQLITGGCGWKGWW